MVADCIFEARPLPNGTHVLVPRIRLPRTCRRLDGVVKVAFDSRAEARRARPKHQHAYRCPNCRQFHLATDRRRAA